MIPEEAMEFGLINSVVEQHELPGEDDQDNKAKKD